MQHLVWGVLLFPLAGFVVNSLWQRMPTRAVSIVGPGSVFLAFLCAVVCFFWLQSQPDAARHFDQYGWRWTVAGLFSLNFGLLLDPLSSVMTLIITGVGFLILLYSVGYMAGEDGYRRFFSQMDLFIFTMLLLVLADNYLWLLVGWAGVGLTSYLLIGYYYERPSAVAAARKAFVMNVIGDWGMMVAIFMMFIYFGGVSYSQVFSHVGIIPYDGRVIRLIGLLLLVGAVAKSAQLPLYTWLPDAMEGPTPVSALIHAATMVTAGVYLIARSYPIYQQAPFDLHVVAFIGAIGCTFAATMALANNDIKRVLAYSTMSQIGYMFAGVGVAVYSAGLFHLLTHAFFKALLFMGAGAVMHAMRDELDIQRMGGLRNKLPFTYWTFLIGVIAIAGIPPLAGFFSKEDIIGGAFFRASHGDTWLWIVWALTVLTAFLTALYMFRLFYVVFHGEPRDRALYDHAHDPALTMKVPMVILTFLSIVGGIVIAFPGLYNLMEAWLHPVFTAYAVRGPSITAVTATTFSGVSLVVVLVVSILGFLSAWAVYLRRNPTPQRVVAIAPAAYQLLYHKYYVDELYDLLFVRPLKWTGRMGNRFIELGLIDGTVNFVGWVTQWGSERARGAQTGYVRNYALGILFGAAVLVFYYAVGGR